MPDLWTADEIATYLKTGVFRGKTTALGPMAEVVKNSTSHMTDDDLKAMGTYLKSIPASSTLRTARAMPSDERIEVASLYMDHCGGCHQAGGRGVPNVFLSAPLKSDGTWNSAHFKNKDYDGLLASYLCPGSLPRVAAAVRRALWARRWRPVAAQGPSASARGPATAAGEWARPDGARLTVHLHPRADAVALTFWHRSKESP